MEAPRSTSTGLKSSGGQTVAVPCTVSLVELKSDGTNACSLVIYDGTSSAGVALLSVAIPASTVLAEIIHIDTPVYANNGIFSVLTGTGATFLLHYMPGA